MRTLHSDFYVLDIRKGKIGAGEGNSARFYLHRFINTTTFMIMQIQ